MKKIYFITGGTGSFARKLIKYLIKKQSIKKNNYFSVEMNISSYN